jgi:hypothetical protein
MDTTTMNVALTRTEDDPLVLTTEERARVHKLLRPLQPPGSQVIQALGYGPLTGVAHRLFPGRGLLLVEFHNGGVYTYLAPYRTHAMLRSVGVRGGSVGRCYLRHVKGKYPAGRVE